MALTPKGSTTEELLLDLMRLLDQAPAANPAGLRNRLLIISTPRSGSTMFCDVLNRTGLIGECWEWFNFRYLEAYGKIRGLRNVDLNEYLNFIVARTIGDSGVFAVNMHVEQYVQLKEKGFDAFTLGFDHVVYLYRQDRIAQALSLARARATDVWVSATEQKEAQIGVAEITASLHHLVASEKIYLDNLQLRVNQSYAYEQFRDMTAPTAFVEVLQALEISADKLIFDTGMKPQSSEKNHLNQAYMDYLQGRRGWF